MFTKYTCTDDQMSVRDRDREWNWKIKIGGVQRLCFIHEANAKIPRPVRIVINWIVFVISTKIDLSSYYIKP